VMGRMQSLLSWAVMCGYATQANRKVQRKCISKSDETDYVCLQKKFSAIANGGRFCKATGGRAGRGG
jgi:hypothetical protein